MIDFVFRIVGWLSANSSTIIMVGSVKLMVLATTLAVLSHLTDSEQPEARAKNEQSDFPDNYRHLCGSLPLSDQNVRARRSFADEGAATTIKDRPHPSHLTPTNESEGGPTHGI